MALPLAPIIAGAIVQVFTKPWPWVLVIGWLVVAKFDPGIFRKEVVATVSSLWWVVILIIFATVGVSILKIYVVEREVTKRKVNRPDSRK